MWIASWSRTPSPVGEKNLATLVTRTTGGAPLSRWATKKAANVAPTRTTKTTRATSVTGGGSASAGLVLAQDHDDLRVGAGRDRLRVDRLDLGRLQAARDLLGRLLRAVGVVDDGRRAAGGVAGDPLRVAHAGELPEDLRGQTVRAGAVEHRHGGRGAHGGRHRARGCLLAGLLGGARG